MNWKLRPSWGYFYVIGINLGLLMVVTEHPTWKTIAFTGCLIAFVLSIVADLIRQLSL